MVDNFSDQYFSNITSYGEHFSNLKFPNKNSIICSVFDTNNDHSRRLSLQACDALNELRCKNELCDSIIKCDDGSEFPIHRAFLSATSNYFRALFTNGMNETNNKAVEIGEVDSDIMKILIEWSYTRNVVIDSSNVERLLPSADRFQMLGLVSKCIDFLEQCLHCENVIGIRRFAIAYYSNKLIISAENFLMYNFLEVVNSSIEFLELAYEEFYDIIISDELNIRNENELFEIIIKWIDFKPDERKKYLSDLIKCLRLGFITKRYFIERIRTHPYIKGVENLKPILNECSKYFIDLNLPKIADLSDLNIRPRIPHDLLIVVGGWSGGSPTNSIETYDPRADLWQNFDHLDKSPRAYHGCIMLNNQIYIIGGFDGSNYFNNCRKFDMKRKEWQEIAPMHIKRCYVSVARLNGIIYAMGGNDGNNRHNTAEKYTPENNQWSLIADMNECRSDASATDLNGSIYICGGFNGAECLDSVEFYDPDIKIWTMITKMSFRRSGVGLVNYKNALYAIGGYDGFTRLNSCERYDPKYKRWTRFPDMFSPRSNFGICVFDDNIFVMGGFNGITTIENVESFNYELREWRIREKMNLNRSALSVCVLSGIENVRPYSAVKIQTKLEEKLNKIFFNTIINFSTNYLNYVNFN